MKENVIQTAWTKGEISPLAHGRIDVNLYQLGAAEIKNLVVRQQGPVDRRSGFALSNPARDFTNPTRVIPFENAGSSGYALAFGEKHIWVFKDGLPVINTTSTYADAITAYGNSGGNILVTITAFSQTITTIANNGSGLTRITTSGAHGYRTGSKVQITGTGKGALDGLEFSVTYVTTTTFDVPVAFPGAGAAGTAKSCLVRPSDLAIISGSVDLAAANGTWRVKSVPAYNQYVLANSTYAAPIGGAKGSSYTWIVEASTSYPATDVPALSFTQSVDVMYLAHESFATQKLIRYSETSWTISSVTFVDGPYLQLQTASFPNYSDPSKGNRFPDVLWYLSSYAHTATVQTNVAFAAAQVGKYVEWREGDQWRLGVLTVAAAGTNTGTITVIDNVMMYIDETNRITRKGVNPVVPGSSASSPAVSSAGRSGVSGNSIPRSVQQRSIDPKNEVQIDAGKISGQFSNTFGVADVGKYIRYHAASSAAGSWAQITGLVTNSSGKSANIGAAVAMSNVVPSGILVVSNHQRTAFITAYKDRVDPILLSGTFVLFSAADIGRMFRIGFGGRWTWGRISSLVGAIGNTSSSVAVTLEEDMPRDPHDATLLAGNADSAVPASCITYDWRLGAWGSESFTGISYPTLHGPGFPRTVALHDERLWFGGTKWSPSTMWGSASGDYENFIPTELDSTVVDDDGISKTLVSTKLNSIQWIASGETLIVGTDGSDFQARSGAAVSEPITPGSFRALPYTEHGSNARLLPAKVGSSIMFVDKSLRKMVELYYAFTEDRVNSSELSTIAEHMLRDRGGAAGMVCQQSPNTIIWIWCADGSFVGVTVNKQQEVIAWHGHYITGGSVESMAVTPSTSGDRLWASVKRTISGSTYRTIEFLAQDFTPASQASLLGMRFQDSHTVVSNYGGTTISGLDYLEGVTVVPTVNGVVGTPAVVTSGAITLPVAGNEVVIGVQSDAYLVSLPPEGGSRNRVSQGQMKKIITLDVRTINAISLSVGEYGQSVLKSTLDPSSGGVYANGTFRLTPEFNYHPESKWVIKQQDPLPLTLLFVVSKLECEE